MKSSTKLAAAIIGITAFTITTGAIGYQIGFNNAAENISAAHTAGAQAALCEISRTYPQPPAPYKAWECVWPGQVSNATLIEHAMQNKCVCG